MVYGKGKNFDAKNPDETSVTADGFEGVSPEYQNYAVKTDKPLEASESVVASDASESDSTGDTGDAGDTGDTGDEGKSEESTKSKKSSKKSEGKSGDNLI